MKKLGIIIITGIVLVLSHGKVFAQNTSETRAIVIEPYHLTITLNKTTNLIFPYAIKSVDRGSKDILAQKAEGVENILQIKAGKLRFEQTNLSVITADGTLYSYILDYTDKPGVLNIRFDSYKEIRPQAFLSSGSINEAQMQADAETVAHEKRSMPGIGDKRYGIKMLMDGLFIKDDVLYCRIKLQNTSNINYGIGQLRFFIRDQKKSKRTATQELEINPLYVKGDTAVVTGKTRKTFVFALLKFTIPDEKYLAIELQEKSGGRHLQLRVGNRTIVKAKPILDLH